MRRPETMKIRRCARVLAGRLRHKTCPRGRGRTIFRGEPKMRKLIMAMIAAISIPAIALAQASDAKAKADQILKQSRATIGDEKKLKDLQGLSFAGMVRQSIGDRQLESELEIDVLMPDKVRKTTNSQRGTETQTFNGVDFWRDFVPAVTGGPGGGFRGGGGPGGPGGFGGPGGAGAANSPMASYFQLQQRRGVYQIMLGWLLTAPASAQVEFAFAGEAPRPQRRHPPPP